MFDQTKVPFPSAVHPRFNAGRVWITLAARTLCDVARIRECLSRHVRGDRGVVGLELEGANDCAARAQQTVRSAYAVDPSRSCSLAENCLWVVTDRTAGKTLLLLAGEIEVWP